MPTMSVSSLHEIELAPWQGSHRRCYWSWSFGLFSNSQREQDARPCPQPFRHGAGGLPQVYANATSLYRGGDVQI